MDPLLSSFLVSVAANVATNSGGALLSALQRTFAKRTELQALAQKDPLAALAEAAGMIEAMAGTGEISISGAELKALRAAKFDHQDGAVFIGNARIDAPFVQIGGTGRGQTTLTGGTESRSQGTSMKLKGNASIAVKGNATIKQS